MDISISPIEPLLERGDVDYRSLEVGDTSGYLDSAEMGTFGLEKPDICGSMPLCAQNTPVEHTNLGSDKENKATDGTEALAGTLYVTDGDDILMEEQVGGGGGAHPYSLRRHLSAMPNATKMSRIAVSSRLNTMEEAGPIFPLHLAPTSLSKDSGADRPPTPRPLSPHTADSPTPLGKGSLSDFLSQGDFREISLPAGPIQPTAPPAFFPPPGLPHPPKLPAQKPPLVAPTSGSPCPPVIVQEVCSSEEELDEDQASDTLPSGRGRIPEADLAILASFYERVDELFKEASAAVKRPISIDAIIDRWSDGRGKKRSTNLWNAYQVYFAGNPDIEMARVTDGSKPSVKKCYQKFLELGSPKYTDILATWSAWRRTAPNTLGERDAAFKKYVKELENLVADGALCRFETVVITVGNCVHEDTGVSHIATSSRLETFFSDRLKIDEHDLTGLAKAHAFNITAQEFTNQYTPPTVEEPPKGKITSTNKKDDVDEEEGSPSALCRTGFVALFAHGGCPLTPSSNGQVQVPWTKMAKYLCKCSKQMNNWPFPVPFPTETSGSKTSQGIKDLKSDDALLLLSALNAGSITLSSADKKAMQSDLIPVITTTAPPSNDRHHAHGKRLFLSGKKDFHGPPRPADTAATRKRKIAKQSPSGQEIIDLAGDDTPLKKPATKKSTGPSRKRSACQEEEAESDDDDDLPLVPTTKRRRTVVLSDDDPDPEGIFTMPSDDGEYDDVVERRPDSGTTRSPIKTRKTTGKPKSKPKNPPVGSRHFAQRTSGTSTVPGRQGKGKGKGKGVRFETVEPHLSEARATASPAIKPIQVPSVITIRSPTPVGPGSANPPSGTNITTLSSLVAPATDAEGIDSGAGHHSTETDPIAPLQPAVSEANTDAAPQRFGINITSSTFVDNIFQQARSPPAPTERAALLRRQAHELFVSIPTFGAQLPADTPSGEGAMQLSGPPLYDLLGGVDEEQRGREYGPPTTSTRARGLYDPKAPDDPLPFRAREPLSDTDVYIRPRPVLPQPRETAPTCTSQPPAPANRAPTTAAQAAAPTGQALTPASQAPTATTQAPTPAAQACSDPPIHRAERSAPHRAPPPMPQQPRPIQCGAPLGLYSYAQPEQPPTRAEATPRQVHPTHQDIQIAARRPVPRPPLESRILGPHPPTSLKPVPESDAMTRALQPPDTSARRRPQPSRSYLHALRRPAHNPFTTEGSMDEPVPKHLDMPPSELGDELEVYENGAVADYEDAHQYRPPVTAATHLHSRSGPYHGSPDDPTGPHEYLPPPPQSNARAGPSRLPSQLHAHINSKPAGPYLQQIKQYGTFEGYDYRAPLSYDDYEAIE